VEKVENENAAQCLATVHENLWRLRSSRG